MTTALINHHLVLKKSPLHGYGVFAEKKIRSGEIIEECHMLLIPDDTSGLSHYLFAYKETMNALALGFGSIYNHAEHPNANYHIDEERHLIVFVANNTINAGDEILISYGESWFSEREIKPKTLSFWEKYRSWLDIPCRAIMVLGGMYGLIYGLMRL